MTSSSKYTISETFKKLRNVSSKAAESWNPTRNSSEEIKESMKWDDKKHSHYVIPCECKPIDCEKTDFEQMWKRKLQITKSIDRNSWMCIICNQLLNYSDIKRCSDKSINPKLVKLSCGSHFVHSDCKLIYNMEKDINDEDSEEDEEEHSDDVKCVYCTCDICNDDGGHIYEFACGCIYHRECIGEELFDSMDPKKDCCHICNYSIPQNLAGLEIPSISEQHFIKLKKCRLGHLIFFGPWQIHMLKCSDLGRLDTLYDLGITLHDLKYSGIKIQTILGKRHFDPEGVKNYGGMAAIIKTFCDNNYKKMISFVDLVSTLSGYYEKKEDEDLDPKVIKTLGIGVNDLVSMKITCSDILSFAKAEKWVDAYGKIAVAELLSLCADYDSAGMQMKLSTNQFPILIDDTSESNHHSTTTTQKKSKSLTPAPNNSSKQVDTVTSDFHSVLSLMDQNVV